MAENSDRQLRPRIPIQPPAPAPAPERGSTRSRRRRGARAGGAPATAGRGRGTTVSTYFTLTYSTLTDTHTSRTYKSAPLCRPRTLRLTPTSQHPHVFRVTATHPNMLSLLQFNKRGSRSSSSSSWRTNNHIFWSSSSGGRARTRYSSAGRTIRRASCSSGRSRASHRT